jgi:hypothetical protein
MALDVAVHVRVADDDWAPDTERAALRLADANSVAVRDDAGSRRHGGARRMRGARRGGDEGV